MPNGKPGDTPLHDILVHGLDGGFPADIAELVRDLGDQLRADAELYRRVDQLLWDQQPSPYRGSDLAAVRQQLRSFGRR